MVNNVEIGRYFLVSNQDPSETRVDYVSATTKPIINEAWNDKLRSIIIFEGGCSYLLFHLFVVNRTESWHVSDFSILFLSTFHMIDNEKV